MKKRNYILYLIFESNSHHKFYFLKSFSKKLKIYIFGIELNENLVKFNKNNMFL